MPGNFYNDVVLNMAAAFDLVEYVQQRIMFIPSFHVSGLQQNFARIETCLTADNNLVANTNFA